MPAVFFCGVGISYSKLAELNGTLSATPFGIRLYFDHITTDIMEPDTVDLGVRSTFQARWPDFE